jgi:hypothetical protein
VLEPGTEIPVYRMLWRKRDSAEVIRDVAVAATMMLGEKRVDGLEESLKKALFVEDEGSWERLEVAPQILVKYEPAFDEFRLINEDIDVQRDATGRVSEREAQKLTEKVLRVLADRKVIDARLYRDAALQVGYRLAGSGAIGGKPDPGHVVEYRFTYRPRLAGIQLANAGVRIGVMICGGISSMRVGGVTPIGELKGEQLVPTRGGEVRKVEATANQLMTRFYRQLPPNVDPAIASSRIMYAMPDGKQEAVVAPQLIVSFSERHPTRDRGFVVSRRRIVGFSIVDAKAEPFDFTAPGQPKPDNVQRKQ